MTQAQTQARSQVVPPRSGSIPAGEPSDEQLLGRFNAQRDDRAEAAFAALIDRHGPMVWRVCDQILGDRHDAEDAFQACFLVLARRSSSIRQPELLGNWLYGVALRTAREARMRTARRRRLEVPAAVASEQGLAGLAGQPEAMLLWREEMRVLHEEVARLPARYRLPVVLCEFEGLTYQEVARRLDCPVSTIGVRLIRARDRLRTRLIRRGIAPAAALASAIHRAENASALLSASLVQATTHAVTYFLLSDVAATATATATRAAPTAVLALTSAVLRSMRVAQLKLASTATLVAGLTAALGFWVGSRSVLPPVVEPTTVASTAGAISLASAPATTTSIAAAPPADPAPVDPVAAPAAPPADHAVVAIGFDATRVPALALLQPSIRDEIARGENLFFKEWVANDPASPHGDGLGPVFNETSCVACHNLGAPGGAGSEGKNIVILTAVSASGQNVPQSLQGIHPGFRNTRSIVLHRYGTDHAYRSWRRDFFDSQRDQNQAPTFAPGGEQDGVVAQIRRVAAQTGPGQRARELSSRLKPGVGVTLRVSERNSPALFGVGQIDAIPTEVILAGIATQPDAVRGRASRMRDGRVGRFGWKGQIGSLHEFVRGACASELGLEVPGHAQSASPVAPLEKAKGLDLTQTDCDAMVAYIRSLPAPVVVEPTEAHAQGTLAAGRRLFAEVGCAGCHTPSLGEVRGIYSDLLLHDMGTTLGDSGSSYGIEGPESPGDPSPGEWRTPPLWGFRNSGPYLHDGRAEDLEEAVALHGGSAMPVTRQFFALSTADQTAVEAFLKSLVAPSPQSGPGTLLAAQFEEQVEPNVIRQAEAEVRQRRNAAEAIEVAQKAEIVRRRQAEAAAKRAVGRFEIATRLEKAGKMTGALGFYQMIVEEAPDTREGRLSAARIKRLTPVPVPDQGE